MDVYSLGMAADQICMEVRGLFVADWSKRANPSPSS